MSKESQHIKLFTENMATNGPSRVKQKNKNQQKKSNGKANETTGDTKIDESILQKPVETNVNSISKLIQVLHNGTQEVQDFISKECELLFECLICRNMFRSIANFILHKRLYCKELYNHMNHHRYIRRYLDDDEILDYKSDDEEEMETIIEESKLDNDDNGSENSDSGQQKSSKKKSLATIVDNLANKNQMKDITFTNDFDGKMINLQPVDGNKSGVFQTIFEKRSMNDIDLMKNEINEIEKMSNNEAVIGPDGLCLVTNSENLDEPSAISTINSKHTSTIFNNAKHFTCKICDLKYLTMKTLRFHINTKHNDSRIVFPCTDCAETFVSPWGVYRHLLKTHKRTMAEVRRLRNTIQTNSYVKDQPPPQYIQRRVRAQDAQNAARSQSSKLMQSPLRTIAEDREWNLDYDIDFQCCGGCGRRFERRAALNSHALMCSKRSITQAVTSTNANTKNSATSVRPTTKRKTAIANKLVRDKSLIDSSESRPTSDSELQAEESEEEAQEVPLKDPLSTSDSEDKNQKTKNAQKSKQANTAKTNNSTSEKQLNKQDSSSDKQPVNKTNEKQTNNEKQMNKNENDKSNKTNRNEVNDTKQNKIIKTNESEKQMTNKNDKNLVLLRKNENIKLIKIKDKKDTLSSKDIVSIRQILTPQLIAKYINDAFGQRIKNFTTMGKEYICKPCNCKFNTVISLRRHMSFHFNWKRFRCMTCKFMTFEKREALLHAKNTHNCMPENIRKFIVRMTDAESEKYSSDAIIPMNEVIILEDSDEDGSQDRVDPYTGDLTSKENTDNENEDEKIKEGLLVIKKNVSEKVDEQEIKVEIIKVEEEEEEDKKENGEIKKANEIDESCSSDTVNISSESGASSIQVLSEIGNENEKTIEIFHENEILTQSNLQESEDGDEDHKDLNFEEEYSSEYVMEMILGPESRENKDLNDEDIKSKHQDLNELPSIRTLSNNDDDVESSHSSNSSSPPKKMKKINSSNNTVNTRPIRNRSKRLNTDFIYDFSSLTKEYQNAATNVVNLEETSPTKRKVPQQFDDVLQSVLAASKIDKKQKGPIKKSSNNSSPSSSASDLGEKLDEATKKTSTSNKKIKRVNNNELDITKIVPVKII